MRPVALVVSTHVMEEDCKEFGLPILVLPHHARPNQQANPIREHVATVGYEGAENYLGSWQQVVREECRMRGWQFVINPLRLCDVDIVLGLRCFSGYTARNWKSNVKLANAQGSGTPCIMNRESGYMETAKLGVAWADDRFELALSFKILANYHLRKSVADVLMHSRLTLENVAQKYKLWLNALAI